MTYARLTVKTQTGHRVRFFEFEELSAFINYLGRSYDARGRQYTWDILTAEQARMLKVAYRKKFEIVAGT